MQRIVGKGLVTKEPKTKAGQRTVDLPSTIVTLLSEVKQKQAANKEKLGADYQDNDLVFCLADGRPLDPHGLSRRFHKLTLQAGFPNLRFHDLRHTHATLLFAQGEKVHTVQERLGHEDPSTTISIYGHALPGSQKAAADRFDRAFGDPSNDGQTEK